VFAFMQLWRVLGLQTWESELRALALLVRGNSLSGLRPNDTYVLPRHSNIREELPTIREPAGPG
jgi:hypothetical protein